MYVEKPDFGRNVPKRLLQFNPEIIFSPKTLGELNASVPFLNNLKGKLSSEISYYLRTYKGSLDIPRLCRALGVPSAIANEYKSRSGIKDSAERIVKLETLPLDSFKMLNKVLNPIAVTANNEERQYALIEDMHELAEYFKIYCDIEDVFKKSELEVDFLYGNSFSLMLDIIDTGSVITRFKYVSDRNTKEKPAEKIVSYHPMSLRDGAVLAVHVEGDKRFSMFKGWGSGDEKLTALYSEYNSRVIRWGYEQVLETINGREDKRIEFLY